MLSNFIELGTKVEIHVCDRMAESEGVKPKVYYSTVYDIVSEDRLEISMPTEKTKLVLLSDLYDYDLIFYCPTGLYQCSGKGVERYKNGNAYLMLMEMTSNLKKYQRREYFRFNCAIELGTRLLDEEEVDATERMIPYSIKTNIPLTKSVIVDISGGGLRFLSSQKYRTDDYILCSFNLLSGVDTKRYMVPAQILGVKAVENKRDVYEHRVKFYKIDMDTREEIIKYIFEEERKNLKKDRPMR